jgi:Arc/MetJ-type ribon-helix-helix transcriptional regulator
MNESTKILHVVVSTEYTKIADRFIERGEYASYSEIVRKGLRQVLEADLEFELNRATLLNLLEVQS